ncbi:hypothetical protein [Pseudomonas bubulae]|uniref:hypothetical protein n=1 Tax=Pseudomonas bubulae TaxID=2316085 RepID=UPI0039A34F3B
MEFPQLINLGVSHISGLILYKSFSVKKKPHQRALNFLDMQRLSAFANRCKLNWSIDEQDSRLKMIIFPLQTYTPLVQLLPANQARLKLRC